MAGYVTPENAERNALIIKKYRDGVALAEIASAVNVSRNVVAGVINRAGLNERGGARLPYVDLTGNRLNRFTVLRRDGSVRRSGEPIWLCACDCGRVIRICSSNLKGTQRSCGCLKAENAKKSGELRLKIVNLRHSGKKSREIAAQLGMPVKAVRGVLSYAKRMAGG